MRGKDVQRGDRFEGDDSYTVEDVSRAGPIIVLRVRFDKDGGEGNRFVRPSDIVSIVRPWHPR